MSPITTDFALKAMTSSTTLVNLTIGQIDTPTEFAASTAFMAVFHNFPFEAFPFD